MKLERGVVTSPYARYTLPPEIKPMREGIRSVSPHLVNNASASSLFSDACLELPFILTHPNNPDPPLAGILDGDFHFTEAARGSDSEGGGEGNHTPPPPPPHPPTNGTPGRPPQMGVLARRAANSNASEPTASTAAAAVHIAEFLRASEMPDGMAAFAPEVKQIPPPPQPPAPQIHTNNNGCVDMDGDLSI